MLYMFRRGRAGKMHKVATLCRVSEFGKSISCDRAVQCTEKQSAECHRASKRSEYQMNIRHFIRFTTLDRIEHCIMFDRTDFQSQEAVKAVQDFRGWNS